MKHYVLRLKSFIADNERLLLPAFLLFGFVVDSITLRRVDLLPETILVYAYLTLSGGAILLMHLAQSGIFKGKLLERIEPLLPLALSYAFGSLFSAFVIFYIKSASIADSWPFIAVLVLVVIGLEIFKEYRARLLFNLSVYFLALFSFSIFAVPLWLGSMGPDIFIASAVVAVILFAIFCGVLYLLGKRQVTENLKGIAYSIGTITTLMVVLYTANLLPPIPLVLRDVGPYHYVARDENAYRLLGERVSIIDRVFGITVHLVRGEPLYVFSSVFTPVKIETDIVHRWEYWSELEGGWVLSHTVTYPAEGGREDGYRGFSFKRNMFQGKWRITVETPDSLKIGRTTFDVVEVIQVPALTTTIR